MHHSVTPHGYPMMPLQFRLRKPLPAGEELCAWATEDAATKAMLAPSGTACSNGMGCDTANVGCWLWLGSWPLLLDLTRDFKGTRGLLCKLCFITEWTKYKASVLACFYLCCGRDVPASPTWAFAPICQFGYGLWAASPRAVVETARALPIRFQASPARHWAAATARRSLPVLAT